VTGGWGCGRLHRRRNLGTAIVTATSATILRDRDYPHLPGLGVLWDRCRWWWLRFERFIRSEAVRRLPAF